MKDKTIQDYIKAVRRKRREEELVVHSKPISLRPSRIVKSKKSYKRKKIRITEINDL